LVKYDFIRLPFPDVKMRTILWSFPVTSLLDGTSEYEILLSNPVPLVHLDDDRTVAPGPLLLQPDAGDNDHLVPGSPQAGRGPVQGDHPGPGPALHSIGLEPRPVGDVHHLHDLIRQNIGGAEQAPVDGDASLVMEFRFRDRGPVNLGFYIQRSMVKP